VTRLIVKRLVVLRRLVVKRLVVLRILVVVKLASSGEAS
jgi:hypothetical protein